MDIRFIKCSFNKDADPAHPEREQLYTYATTDAVVTGDLAQVIDGKGAGKRVRVMETGLPQPKFKCAMVKLWVAPALEAPTNSTPNMAGDDYAAAKAASANAGRDIMHDGFKRGGVGADKMPEALDDDADSLDFEGWPLASSSHSQPCC